MVVRWLWRLLAFTRPLRFQTIQVKSFLGQVDKDMAVEVDGVGGIRFLTDGETFFLQAASYMGDVPVIEDFIQAGDGIGIGGFPFRLEGNQFRVGHFEDFAKEISFRFVGRMEPFHPCDAVVPVNRFRHVRFQRSCLPVKVDDTFLYIGVLLPQLLVDVRLGYLGIEGEQLIDKVFYAVETLLRGGEVQQFVNGQYPCPVDDGLVRMVNYHVAIMRILSAEKNDVDAEFLFQFLLQFFLVGTYIPVLFEDAPQLAAAFTAAVARLIQGFNFRKRKALLYLATVLDEDGAVLLVNLVAHGKHDGLELGEGGKSVLLGGIHAFPGFLLPVVAENAVNHFLRTPPLVVVFYLPAVRGDARGDDMDVGVVGVVMGIGKQRLPFLHVAHFFKVLVSELQHFVLKHFVPLAGEGDMELCFLNPVVPGGVFHEVTDQFIRGGLTECPECPEVFYLKQSCRAFRDLTFIVTDGVEVRAAG